MAEPSAGVAAASPAGGAGRGWRAGAIREHFAGLRRPSWPHALALALALIPVATLTLIALALLRDGVFALQRLGLESVLSPETRLVTTAAASQFGILAPAWGTLLLTAVALLIALPVSLAIAISTREYRLGPLSRAMDGILGLLAGIPPIVYFVMGTFFARSLMEPKFAGAGLGSTASGDVDLIRWTILQTPDLGPVQVPKAGVAYTLLGGLVLALLIIPFIAPQIDDTMRRVPAYLAQASYALGAGRWHTLTHVILPWCTPGIVSAATLGALMAMGEVLVPAYFAGQLVAGGDAIRFPNPVFDVFDRVPPLSAVGAGLMGGFSPEARQDSNPLRATAASLNALVLLLVALLLMVSADRVQRRLQRRFQS